MTQINSPKVVLITGAGTGIGAASAIKFASLGYNVVLVGRRAEKLTDLATKIGPEKCLCIPTDISKPAQIKLLIEQVITTYGRLDVLVNNAAMFHGGTINTVSLEDWNEQLAVNLTAPYLLIKSAIGFLEKTKGAIVNVSSVSGLGGDWGAFAYNATKGGLNLMTQALALDFAPQGVRINAVAPTLTKTDMTDFIMDNTTVMNAFQNRIAMQRIGQPEDIADAIVYLSSDEAKFITGVILPVDGGLRASNGQPKIG
jgi:meso-butanediol dehydrogenase/(S,S)-butanediol dehydrogenase/diacetyl reductase